MNDYIDYNNEEVSNYAKVVDPREHNVVNRINELSNHPHILIEDDVVTIDKMKYTHHDIIEESEEEDIEIKKDISDIKKEIEDESIIIVGDEE